MFHTTYPAVARRARTLTLICALVPLVALQAQAQAKTDGKTVVPEAAPTGLEAFASEIGSIAYPQAVPAFQAMNQWLTTYVLVMPQPAPVAAPQVQAWQVGATGARSYEPHPVIVGVPDLPLWGATAAQPQRQWDGALNYQGAHMSLLVVDAANGQLVQRPLSYAVQVGERFKIRITPTFDAVTELDQLVGEVWRSERTGQAYPDKGTSVAIKAGQTVDLPLGQNLFFAVDGKTLNERMVISLRHPRAIGGVASDQPNYRQDSPSGSSYVQLVPKGKFPMLEQVVSVHAWSK